MEELKVGDIVKVVRDVNDGMEKEDSAKDVGTVGVIAKTIDAMSLADAEDGYFLDIQKNCIEPYFYESQLEITEKVREEEYEQAINNLMEENKDLIEQLDYADKQLEKQAKIIEGLEDLAHELHDKLIARIKGD